jgi:1,2-diacylglycerol 3-alpha-glucosyltransferase
MGGRQETDRTDGGSRLFRLVASGRLSNEKDQATLLRAVALSHHKDQIDLRICGIGPVGARLRREAAHLGIRARIGFVRHERLVHVLRGADLFVHPSIVDIESISALEAIACGLVPVIAEAPLSAAGQFALDGRSLYPAKDARALAQRIDWWIEHPRQRAEMSPRYAAYARDEFSLETSVHRFVAMEREAIADFDADRAQQG